MSELETELLRQDLELFGDQSAELLTIVTHQDIKAQNIKM